MVAKTSWLDDDLVTMVLSLASFAEESILLKSVEGFFRAVAVLFTEMR
jgi:hypothetical protein